MIMSDGFGHRTSEEERALEYRSSQIAFTSELVQQIEDLARKNLELEGRVVLLEEELKLRVNYANEVRELQYKLNCIESQQRMDRLAEQRKEKSE